MTSNPLQALTGLFANQVPRQNQQIRPQINQQQFRQVAPNITQDMLVQVARQARARGISEQDIEAGINFIQSLR